MAYYHYIRARRLWRSTNPSDATKLESPARCLSVAKLSRGETLHHEGDSVRGFFSTRVGIEASGSMQWFLELIVGVGDRLPGGVLS